MKKKPLLIMLFIVFSGFNLYNGGRDEYIYCEIRCCNGNSRLDQKVIFTEDGLLCEYPLYKSKKDKVLFIQYDKLDLKKVEKLEEYLFKGNFFNYDSVYACKSIVLDGAQRTIILRQGDKFKSIKYCYCYKNTLDSIIFYVNSLIPLKKRRLYEITTHNTGVDNDCPCTR